MTFLKMVSKYWADPHLQAVIMRNVTIGSVILAFILVFLYRMEKKARKCAEQHLQVERMNGKLKEKDEQLGKLKSALEMKEIEIKELRENCQKFQAQIVDTVKEIGKKDEENVQLTQDRTDLVQKIELWRQMSALYLDNDTLKRLREKHLKLVLEMEEEETSRDKRQLLGGGDEKLNNPEDPCDGPLVDKNVVVQEKKTQSVVGTKDDECQVDTRLFLIPGDDAEEDEDALTFARILSELETRDPSNIVHSSSTTPSMTLKRKKSELKFLDVLRRRFVKNPKESSLQLNDCGKGRAATLDRQVKTKVGNF